MRALINKHNNMKTSHRKWELQERDRKNTHQIMRAERRLVKEAESTKTSGREGEGQVG